MPPEDYQSSFCFECDGELLESEKYVDFMKKKTPDLFD